MLDLNPHTLLGKIKIAVVGGNGFIGQHFIYRLLNQENLIVYSLDSNISKNYIHIPKDAKFILNQINIDVCSTGVIQNFLLSNNIDVVVYCAGAESPVLGISESHYTETTALSGLVNTLAGTSNIIVPEAQKKPYFLYLSSATVYGENKKKSSSEGDNLRPTNYTGMLKMAAEDLVHQYMGGNGHDYAILRLPEVFGRQSHNSLMDMQKGMWRGYLAYYTDLLVRKTESIEVYSPTTKYDLVHVNYVAKFIADSIVNRRVGIYNVGSGNSYTLLDIISIIKQHLPDNQTKIEKSTRLKIPNSLLNCTLAHSLVSYTGNYDLDDFIKDYVPIRRYEIGKDMAISQILSEKFVIDASAYGAQEALRQRKQKRLENIAKIINVAGDQFEKIEYGTFQDRSKRLLEDNTVNNILIPEDRQEYLDLLKKK